MEGYITGNIVLPDKILYGGTVRWKDGKITEITTGENDNVQDLPYILPGLIDIHNHGALGHDYMSGTEETFTVVSEYLAQHGVTSAQCATVTAPIPQLQEFLNAFRAWKQKGKEPGCRFTGVHLEGPFLSVKNKGAHPLEALRTPEDGYDWILENRDIVGEITLAPELPGTPQMIESLYQAGIVISGGHDDAEPEDIEAAMKAGMCHCTHIYCAMSTLHKTGLQRRCGLCEYAMSDNSLTAEMIADNHHTPPQLAQMIYKCKGADKACVVSDAIAAAGGKEGQWFTLGSGEDCTKVFVEDGVAIMEDKTHYAGSVQALDQMLRNLVNDAAIPLVDAVRMASLTPAEVVGIDEECGSISLGKRADFCIMDANLNVQKTVVDGKTVYER